MRFPVAKKYRPLKYIEHGNMVFYCQVSAVQALAQLTVKSVTLFSRMVSPNKE
jgi:hypothetical protein